MLRTARQIMDGMAGLEEMTGHALPLRIGVNRGNVFAGRFGPDFRRTFSIKGDAVNLAARVMGKAAHGEILATAAVLDRCATQFETEPLPPFLVKGKSMPIHAAKVGAVRGLRTDRRTETPFVGREPELADLRAALSRARAAPAGRSRWSASRASGSPGWSSSCWPRRRRPVGRRRAGRRALRLLRRVRVEHGLLPLPTAAPRGARPRSGRFGRGHQPSARRGRHGDGAASRRVAAPARHPASGSTSPTPRRPASWTSSSARAGSRSSSTSCSTRA